MLQHFIIGNTISIYSNSMQNKLHCIKILCMIEFGRDECELSQPSTILHNLK